MDVRTRKNCEHVDVYGVPEFDASGTPGPVLCRVVEINNELGLSSLSWKIVCQNEIGCS